MLVIDGNMNKAKINHLINDLSDMDLDLGEELIETNDNEGLVVFPLNKAISESALNIIKDKHSDLNVSISNRGINMFDSIRDNRLFS